MTKITKSFLRNGEDSPNCLDETKEFLKLVREIYANDELDPRGLIRAIAIARFDLEMDVCGYPLKDESHKELWESSKQNREALLASVNFISEIIDEVAPEAFAEKFRKSFEKIHGKYEVNFTEYFDDVYKVKNRIIEILREEGHRIPASNDPLYTYASGIKNIGSIRLEFCYGIPFRIVTPLGSLRILNAYTYRGNRPKIFEKIKKEFNLVQESTGVNNYSIRKIPGKSKTLLLCKIESKENYIGNDESKKIFECAIKELEIPIDGFK